MLTLRYLVRHLLSCSAFTSDPVQGGEPGLAELRRVIKSGGKLIIIWPRTQDHDWLAERGFHYVVLPVHEEMRIRFRTLWSALRLRERKPEIPFSMIGLNPPCDYCWLRV